MLFVVGDCGTIPTVANSINDAASPNPATSPVGTTITYTCDTGYEFSTQASATLSVTCQGDNSWSTFANCESKFRHS